MNIITPEQTIEPILKWPGGKQDELGIILPSLPETINNYYEPFLGGGAVYLTIPSASHAFVNDKSEDLINLYQMVARQDKTFLGVLYFLVDYSEFLENILDDNLASLLKKYGEYIENKITELEIREVVNQFTLSIRSDLIAVLKEKLPQDIEFFVKTLASSLFEKIKRMRKISSEKGQLIKADIQDNFEAALKASFYYYLRHIHNYSAKFQLSRTHRAAIFFFIRENAYASMFRFNKDGHFNIPYGGISYNRKNLKIKVERLQNQLLVERLVNTQFGNTDFEEFLRQFPPQSGDFLFLDPPYDTEFSSYDQNTFDKLDQERLAKFLINHCSANFMLVIKDTPFISSIYNGQNLNIKYFDKKYMYTVKERNNRDAIHLLITNY